MFNRKSKEELAYEAEMDRKEAISNLNKLRQRLIQKRSEIASKIANYKLSGDAQHAQTYMPSLALVNNQIKFVDDQLVNFDVIATQFELQNLVTKSFGSLAKLSRSSKFAMDTSKIAKQQKEIAEMLKKSSISMQMISGSMSSLNPAGFDLTQEDMDQIAPFIDAEMVKLSGGMAVDGVPTGTTTTSTNIDTNPSGVQVTGGNLFDIGN